jgi:hypothetical protein
MSERKRSDREVRLRGFARRLFRELEGEETGDETKRSGDSRKNDEGVRAEDTKRSEPSGEGESARGEAWALLGALLETGDKAKTEMVRLIARELRSYLEALELHKDLHHLLTNYSLEVHASLHLKPLREDTPPAPSTVGFDLKVRENGDEDPNGGSR